LILTEKLDNLKLMKKDSRIPEFFKLNRKEKQKAVKEFAGLSKEEINIIEKGILESSAQEKISENVIGSFSLPYSVAPNFLINKKDYIVPMVTDEPSVVAAASFGAKMTRESGGIFARNLGNSMIGQIYLVSLKDITLAKEKIVRKKEEILESANKKNPVLLSLGGGAKDLDLKILKVGKSEEVLRIHLFIDTKDAMGEQYLK